MAAPAQGAEVGVVPDITWGQPRHVVDREVALLEEAGVQWVRANVNWRYIEPSEGRIDQGLLNEYDYAVGKARDAGIKVLMLIGGNDVPYWASGDPSKHTDSSGQHWDKRYPPADMADYASLTRFTVEHFSPMGVNDYEIWNEPNLSVFWSPRPNARRYADMLKAAYPAAKAANPDANVILGGLSRNDYVFLEQVYAAGGGPFFDAVAVHPYSFKESPNTIWYGRDDWGDMRNGEADRISWSCFPGIREVRASMVANGDAQKKVWATEFGWSVTSQHDGVSEATQARYLTDAFEYVEDLRWVKAMFWYQARDNPFYGGIDHFESRMGLFTTDFRLRPSYFALQDYAASARPVEEPPVEEPPVEEPPVGEEPSEPEEVKMGARRRWGGKITRAKMSARGLVDLLAAAARDAGSTGVTAQDPEAMRTGTSETTEPGDGTTDPGEAFTPPVGERVKIQVWRHQDQRWRTVHRPLVREDGTFESRFRMHVRRAASKVKMRAQVPGYGASKPRRVGV